MKLKHYILMMLICNIFIACNDNTTTDPLNWNDGHAVPFPEWYKASQIGYRPAEIVREVEAVSTNGSTFIFNYASEFYFYSREAKKNVVIDWQNAIQHEMYPATKPYFINCPYDKDLYFMGIWGYIQTDSFEKLMIQWYIYNGQSNTFSKVTPSYFVPKDPKSNESNLFNPGAWLDISSEGEDYFFTNKGVYHLQNNEFVEKYDSKVKYLFSVSPNGTIIQTFKDTITFSDAFLGFFLNTSKIIDMTHTLFNFDNFQATRWSSDSKYLISNSPSDTRNFMHHLYEVNIFDVKLTEANNRLILKKKLNFRDTFGVFKVGKTAAYLPNNKLIVSWCEGPNDLGTIYEVDLETNQKTALYP